MPSTKRGTGFSAAETDNLLELMATILPIGGEEYRTKVATGDPNCPPQVRRAKHIQNCLKEKTDMSDGDDDEDDDNDDDNKYKLNFYTTSLRQC
jgi:hypothetical protein